MLQGVRLTNIAPAKPPATFREFSRFVTEGVVQDETFQSSSSERQDAVSDAMFLGFFKTVPGKLMDSTWKSLKGHCQGNFPLVATQAGPGPLPTDFKIGKERPFRSDVLLERVKQIILDEPGCTPHVGEEHRFTPLATRYKNLGGLTALAGLNGFPLPLPGASKLMLMLFTGSTSRYAPTGQETQLSNWIMQQKDGSVGPEDLFRTSYRLNAGDLYGTLMTAENVLSVGAFNKDRQSSPWLEKLQYIRSDSSPHGDHFGSWYHFFGMAVYALQRGPGLTGVANFVESAGSLVLEGKDPQEDHINDLGAEFGLKLRELARGGEIKVDAQVAAQPLLNLKEFSWDRGRPKA